MARHGEQEPPPPRPAQPSTEKKILIVDDDPQVVEVLRRFLEKSSKDYIVQAASTGEEAVASLHLDPPDLVLLDINMPGMNGLDVLKQINRTIAVIMVTGNTDAAPAEALKLGAFAYIPKPFDMVYVEQLVPLALMQRRVPQAWVSRSGV